MKIESRRRDSYSLSLKMRGRVNKVSSESGIETEIKEKYNSPIENIELSDYLLAAIDLRCSSFKDIDLKGHTDSVTCVAYSFFNHLVASGSKDQTIKVWNVLKGREGFTLAGHTSEVSTVSFSVDGKYIVSGSLDNEIKVWNVKEKF